MFRIYLTVLVLTILGFLGCSRKPDPNSLMQKYVERHRSGDIEELLAMHTDDSEFLLPGQQLIKGKTALRKLFEADSVFGSRLIMKGIRANGDTIIIDTVIERNKFFQALGIKEVLYTPGTKLILRNGLIAGTYPAPQEAETRRRILEQYQLLLQWMKKNRPEVLKQLLPDGKPKRGAEAARLWLKILAEWNSQRTSQK